MFFPEYYGMTVKVTFLMFDCQNQSDFYAKFDRYPLEVLLIYCVLKILIID